MIDPKIADILEKIQKTSKKVFGSRISVLLAGLEYYLFNEVTDLTDDNIDY